jgi:hypothetical protein
MRLSRRAALDASIASPLTDTGVGRQALSANRELPTGLLLFTPAAPQTLAALRVQVKCARRSRPPLFLQGNDPERVVGIGGIGVENNRLPQCLYSLPQLPVSMSNCPSMNLAFACNAKSRGAISLAYPNSRAPSSYAAGSSAITWSPR